jgi:hypothetical protein
MKRSNESNPPTTEEVKMAKFILARERQTQRDIKYPPDNARAEELAMELGGILIQYHTWFAIEKEFRSALSGNGSEYDSIVLQIDFPSKKKTLIYAHTVLQERYTPYYGWFWIPLGWEPDTQPGRVLPVYPAEFYLGPTKYPYDKSILLHMYCNQHEFTFDQLFAIDRFGMREFGGGCFEQAVSEIVPEHRKFKTDHMERFLFDKEAKSFVPKVEKQQGEAAKQ